MLKDGNGHSRTGDAMTTATKDLGHEAELEWMKTDHALGRPVDVSSLLELAAEMRREADDQLRSLTRDLNRLIDVADEVLEKLESGALAEEDRTNLVRRLSGILEEVSPEWYD